MYCVDGGSEYCVGGAAEASVWVYLWSPVDDVAVVDSSYSVAGTGDDLAV